MKRWDEREADYLAEVDKWYKSAVNDRQFGHLLVATELRRIGDLLEIMVQSHLNDEIRNLTNLESE